jgi:diguanylate cyclase (GGDEF)-like protein/PAS domain S-box-containing protein
MTDPKIEGPGELRRAPERADAPDAPDRAPEKAGGPDAADASLAAVLDPVMQQAIIENMADGVYFVDPHRKITYWNAGAEHISGYGRDAVVGRRCYDNILNHVDQSGRVLCHTACPLARTIRDGKPREASIWLRHSEGFRRPVRVRTAQVRDAQGRVIGGVEVFSDDTAYVTASEAAEKAEHDALTDALTGLPNRRYFDSSLAVRLENLTRYGWRFGVLIVDIDRFKRVNDESGHVFGDLVLKSVGQTLVGAVRAGDIVSRWGGEEFAVIVEASDAAGLADTAERLRTLVARSEVRGDGRRRVVHVSVGGALATSEDTAGTLLTRADAALYRAKAAGRNRSSIDE